MSAEDGVASDVIGKKQLVKRPQLAGGGMREHKSDAADVMPKVRMFGKLDVLFAGTERQKFEAGASDDVFKVRVRDELHPMAAGGQRAAEADHRMHVAVASQCGDEELRHE